MLLYVMRFVESLPDNFLLFTDTRQKGIFRMDMTSNSYVRIPLTLNDNPISIDYDPVDGRIYWTDVGLKQIRSATIDGNSEKTVRLLGTGKSMGWNINRIYPKCLDI